jgi:serine/threonine protein kinase
MWPQAELSQARAGQWRGLDVAIKTVLFQSGAGDDQTVKIASEAAIASNLVHKNIVATYSHDICNVASAGTNELEIYKFYLVQEFCNGGSLATAISEGLFNRSRMPSRWRLIISLLLSIAEGMEHMHSKRITHGDLNPANILFKVWLRSRCPPARTAFLALH